MILSKIVFFFLNQLIHICINMNVFLIYNTAKKKKKKNPIVKQVWFSLSPCHFNLIMGFSEGVNVFSRVPPSDKKKKKQQYYISISVIYKH